MTDPLKVFIAWDFQKQSPPYPIQSLQLESESPTSPFRIELAGSNSSQGHVFDHLVAKGIRGADRFLAVVDTANANVCFEIGFALGCDKPVALIREGADVPSWIGDTLISAHQIPRATKADDLENLLKQPVAKWLHASRPATHGHHTLLLLPERDPGEPVTKMVLGLFAEPAGNRMGRSMKDFGFDAFPPPQSFDKRSLSQLGDLLSRVERVLWIVTEPLPGERERDGAVNAGNGIVAGFAAAIKLPVHVLRDATRMRPLIDIDNREVTFSGLRELKRLLETLGVARAGTGGFAAVAATPFEAPADSRPAPGSPGLTMVAHQLARELPGNAALEAVAASVGYPVEALQDRTSVDAWHLLLSYVRREGSAERLVQELSGRLPGREDALRAAFAGTAASPARRAGRQAAQRLTDLFRDPFGPVMADAGRAEVAAAVLRVWTLDRLWGAERPRHRRLDEWRRTELRAREAVREAVEAAQREGWIDQERRWVDRDLALDVAADALTRWAERRPAEGARFYRGILDRLDALGETRLEILGRFTHWWSAAIPLATRWRAAALARAQHDVAHLGFAERIHVLRRLSRCDRLLPASPGAVGSSDEPPASLRWAIESGNAALSASLLEYLDVRSPEVYLRYLGHTHGAGRAALLRAARRVLEHAGSADTLPDTPERRVLLAALAEASEAELRPVLADPRTTSDWLDALGSPLNPVQAHALGEIHARSWDASARSRARLRLAKEPDLRSAWRALTGQRRPWIERLEDPERLGLNMDDLAGWLRRGEGQPDTQSAADARLFLELHDRARRRHAGT